MLDKITENITNSFLNYLHLGSWLNMEVHKILTSRKFTFTSVEDFWKKVLNEELRPGDIIKIKEGFLTEWIPRLPGEPWKTLSEKSDNRGPDLDSLKNGSHFSIGSIDYKNLSSLGIVRLPFGHDSLNYAMLSVTSYDCWSIDLSIPIIASKEVYHQFINARRNHQSVESDLEATLEFGDMPLFNNELIASLGTECSQEFINEFTTPVGLPKVYLRLSSILNAKFRSHNSHPSGTIWAISKHSQSHRIIHTVESGEVKIEECEPNEFIGLDMGHFDLGDKELFQHYVNSFKIGESIPQEILDHKRVINPSKKVTVLTEFDGQKRHFKNSIPIRSKPWSEDSERLKIISILKILESEKGQG